MNQVTRKSTEELLGPLDDNVFAAIETTGASLADITVAKSLADGTNDIAGQGESALSGPAKQVLIILSGRNE